MFSVEDKEWLHTSVIYKGGFVNKIKKEILEVFVLLLKN